MITFVCWKWRNPNYRTQFKAEHVNRLAKAISRHYQAPHRVVCVTNDGDGIDPGITVIPDRGDFADVPSPQGGAWPSCYRRLRMFTGDVPFGPRFISIDLDCVITGDLRPLVKRSEDFVGWRDPLRRDQYCGSLIMLQTGSRPQVWSWFDPRVSPKRAMDAGYPGSDQGWISYCLPGEAQWTQDDGVYSFRFDLAEGRKQLPANARIVVFHGKFKPWDLPARNIDWVRQHYQ